jgi:hypothetical protein
VSGRADGVIEPFGNDGVWLRCALHAHTTRSDGMLDPAMLRRYYTMGRFDVLAITDHDELTALPDEESSHPGLVLLNGTEISLRAPLGGGHLHLLGIGVRKMPTVNREMVLSKAVVAVRAEGGVPIVAHPWWSGLTPDELGDLAGVAAIEVYNAGCQVEQGRGDSAQYWDALLSQGIRINAIATDDHHMPGFDAFQGWTMVRAQERSPEAVLAALQAGHYYSSNGPVIHSIRRTSSGFVVESSPAAAIAVLGKHHRGVRVNAGPHGLKHPGDTFASSTGGREGSLEGEYITRATFPPLTGSNYARVEVIDERGRKAWSNPLWLGE